MTQLIHHLRLQTDAIKFSRNGGFVDFELSIAEPGFDPDSYSPPLNNGDDDPKPVVINSAQVLRYTVKDYGKGIARRDYPNIFKPFIQTGERVDNESIYGGTGLGLPITVKLIHALGGSISVQSQEGEWTRFTVDLPFLDNVVNPTTATLGLRDAKVLLITNDANKRQKVLENLRWYNLRCEGFESMGELNSRLEGVNALSSERSLVWLAQEDLFDEVTYESLSNRVASVLITFGPKFLVSRANGHHRSLRKMLPSALISSMLACFQPPETQHPEPSLSRRDSEVAAEYRSLRYLIAEDNLVNQKVLRNILKRLGINNVAVVENGRLAVDREAAEPFDVVLMDMQVSSGCSFCL